MVKQGTECEVEERAFFAKLQSELNKIDSFYGEKERSFLNQCNSLVRQLNVISQAPVPTKLTGRMQLEKKKEILQKACGDLYRGLDFLKNYRILNYTGFVKILKKHDKRAAWTSASKPVLARVVHSPFFTSELTTIIQAKLEELYVRSFTKGNHSKAMV
jgi:SPX domain protein involved in polyphosphate accumulation